MILCANLFFRYILYDVCNKTILYFNVNGCMKSLEVIDKISKCISVYEQNYVNNYAKYFKYIILVYLISVI